MARRIEVGQKVPTVIFQMADGSEYVWSLNMATIKNMAETDVGAFEYLEGLTARFAENPVDTLGELMHMGMKDRYPDMTVDDILSMLPPSIEVLEGLANAMMDAAGDALPDPTNPGVAMNRAMAAPRRTVNGST